MQGRFLYSIDAKEMRNSPCFGVVVEDGIVVEAAPIAKWTVGKSIVTVVLWYLKHNAKIEVIKIGGTKTVIGTRNTGQST